MTFKEICRKAGLDIQAYRPDCDSAQCVGIVIKANELIPALGSISCALIHEAYDLGLGWRPGDDDTIGLILRAVRDMRVNHLGTGTIAYFPCAPWGAE